MPKIYIALKGMNIPFKYGAVNMASRLDKQVFYSANYGNYRAALILKDVISMYIMGGEL